MVMSSVYKQEIGGQVYLYKSTSYWDKKKKQSRSKKVYLGKKDPSTGQLIPKKDQPNSIPVSSQDVGSLHLLKHISKKLNLVQILKKSFPDEYEKILYLSFFKVVTKEPYYLYPLWGESSYVPDDYNLSSESISKLLSIIGNDESSIEQFFMNWINSHKDGSQAVMFDITSISSYGSSNEFLERGYNRDGENLPQINLGVLSQSFKVDSKIKNASLPIAYRLYPGSITDVSTLRNVILLSKEYSLKLKYLVLDKGFYSQENIKSLHQQSLSYIIPMSFRSNLSKQTVSSLVTQLSSPQAAFSYHDAIYWYCQKKVKVGAVDCMAHVYLDKRRKAEQESNLILKLCEFEKFFSKKKFENKEESEVYVRETLKGQRRFFSVQEKDGCFSLQRNLEKIEYEISRMGCVILLTDVDESLSKHEILSLYRNKDSIEKIFSSLKHDLNERRNRTHSMQNMRGSLFINFISLILISWIDHVMKEKKLYKQLSKSEIYKILNRLKFYKMATGKVLLGELSAKQKAIYSAFNVDTKIDPVGAGVLE